VERCQIFPAATDSCYGSVDCQSSISCAVVKMRVRKMLLVQNRRDMAEAREYSHDDDPIEDVC
jgi:hypothetical protein